MQITVVSSIEDLAKNGQLMLDMAAKLGAKAPAATKTAAPKAAPAEEDFNLGEEEETKAEDDGLGGEDDGLGEEPEAPTYDDTLAALQKYKAKHGKDKTLALLKKYNAKSSKELKPSQYASVIAAAKVK